MTAVAWSVARKDRAESLAQLAVDEGSFGNHADKVVKINKRVLGVLADMRHVRTVGVVDEDPARGLVRIAKPVGVVAALIPTTGPDATPPVKALFALKGRNAIVVAPHPRTAGTTAAVVAHMREACEQVGAPADLIQVVPKPSFAATQELMRAADLVVATGGAGMVKAAYSSGTPAFGVGRRQLRARGRRDRRPGRRGVGDRRGEDLRLRDELPRRQRGRRARGHLRRPGGAAARARRVACAPPRRRRRCRR